jgi:hypothetical protein
MNSLHAWSVDTHPSAAAIGYSLADSTHLLLLLLLPSIVLQGQGVAGSLLPLGCHRDGSAP